MDTAPDIELAREKVRILHGLSEILDSRISRLDSAIERGDEPAVDMNRRHLATQESRFMELVACNDWDFWHRSRDLTPGVLFIDLPGARKTH